MESNKNVNMNPVIMCRNQVSHAKYTRIARFHHIKAENDSWEKEVVPVETV